MSLSTGGFFQVAMVDRRSGESSFLREGRSRKSGHKCTVCGAVFGVWASLAEHKEVHYNDRKFLPSQHAKPEKRGSIKSKKLKEQLPSKKPPVSDGVWKHQIINHLTCQPVAKALLTGLSDLKISQQEEMRIAVSHCSSNSANNCRNISRQEAELQSNVSIRTIGNLTEKSLTNSVNCRPQLIGETSDTIVPYRKGKLGCKRKFNNELKEESKCLSSELNDVDIDRHKTSSTTEAQLPNLTHKSDKTMEIVNAQPSVLNKNHHVNANSSMNEYDSKSIGDGRTDKALTWAEVSCVSQGEVSQVLYAQFLKISENKAQRLPEKSDMSKVQNSVLLVKGDFVLQTTNSVETEAESKVCSELSFTINSEELLDVEEEIVCTEDIVEPAPSENSNRHCKTEKPVQDVSPLKLPFDASEQIININPSERSRFVILLNPEESHSEKLGIQMVSLLKSNPSRKHTYQDNAEESCTGAFTGTANLQMKSNTLQTEVTDSTLPPTSQCALVKKIKQSGLGRHLSPKQMISLLKPHQNDGTVSHREENLSEHSSKNRKCETPHSHQSAFGIDIVADTKVVEVVGLNSNLVSAKKRFNIESRNDAQDVASIKQCTSSPFTAIDCVVNHRTSQDFSEEIQCSPTPSDVLAKCNNILLQDKTSGIQLQYQKNNSVNTEMENLGTAVDSNHSAQICKKYLEQCKSDSTSEFLSTEITPEEHVKTLKSEETVHISDFMDSLKDSFDCLLCSEKFSNQAELDVHHQMQHLCLKCDRVFRQTSNLRKHLRVNHESYRPHRCETCGKCFPFLSSLKEHWLVHSRAALERLHICEVCGKAFTRASGLRKHSKEEHLDVKPYVCVQCQKSFAYLCSLRNHMRAHSSERPFSCDACDQKFKQSSNLRKHVRLHHRPKCNQCQGCCVCVQQTDKIAGYGKSTICDVCGRTCEGQKQLMIHMRVHTGEKPEVCDVCGKSFQHKSNLLKHQLKHSGTKAFACKFCGRAFYASHSLLSHMRLHTGESPFHCDTCGKTFCTKNGLQVHSLLHSDTRPFACSTCGKTFTQLGNLNKHVALHTGERPFVCAYCDKGFVDSSALKRHALKHAAEHTLECSNSGKRFQQLSTLQSHELSHVSEQNDGYSSLEFEPLLCACGQSFLHRSNFLRHMKRHQGMSNEVNEIVLNPGEYIVCLTD